MTAQAILNDLLQAGIRPRLTPDRTGIVVPRHAITDALKVAILANKPAIIRLLTEAANDDHHHPELAPPTAPAAPAHDRLLAIAMRFCDAINASDKAREDWRRDVLETPPHLRQGLYNYLREQLRQPNLLWRTP